MPEEINVPRVLADTLRHVEVSGVFYCPSYLREPWGTALPPMPGTVWFHAVVRGGGSLVVREQRYRVGAGDLVIVPHGDGHTMHGATPAPTPLVTSLPHEYHDDTYGILRHGGHGELTEAICGGLRLDHPSARRLLDALPPAIVLAADHPGRDRIDPIVDALGRELTAIGTAADAVVARLCDVIVIQGIRCWLAGDTDDAGPWIRAVRDPDLGPVIAAMHTDPAQPWTVGSLAAVAGMSRSGFAARFTAVLGESPLGYLTELRMGLATDMLRAGDRSVPEIARAVGYESESSFSRAYKRCTGHTPRGLPAEASLGLIA